MSGPSPSVQRIVVSLPVLAAALLVGFSAAYAAESSRLAYLRGVGAGHCPDEKELRSAVAMRLGYDPFVAWAKTTVHAQLGRDGANLRARVYLADEDGRIRGSRELTAPVDECQNLVAAVALAISIAIDPLSATAPSPARDRAGHTEEAPAPAEPEVVAATPTPSVENQGAARERADAGIAEGSQGAPTPLATAWYTGIGPHLASGTSPDLAAGFAGFGRLELGRRASIALEGRYDLPDSALAQSRAGVVTAKLLLASLEPCVRVSPLYFCGLLSVGALLGVGSGVAVPSEQSAVYWGAGGRVAIELGVMAPLLLRAHADLVGNATRTTLRIGGENVWQAPPLAVAGGVSVVVRVW
jgi:hypothetical protein